MKAEQLVREYLIHIGEDPDRPGLRDTPKRIVRSWDELYKGYTQNPKDVFVTFDENNVQGGLVYLRNIEFASMCEHHMLPFTGVAHIGYIPDGRVIGISKLARLLDIYAQRLQIQERIAEQITDALMEYLQPKGAACIIEAVHQCMKCRGVRKQNAVMGYSSLKGAFLIDHKARQEFIQLVKS